MINKFSQLSDINTLVPGDRLSGDLTADLLPTSPAPGKPLLTRSQFIGLLTIAVSVLLFAVFFYEFFADIEAIILTSPADWEKELKYYANIKHQLFVLHQFPHVLPYVLLDTPVLFANPETSVLSPVNLLLPIVSKYNFFCYHLGLHYLVALAGFVAIGRQYKLPHFAVLFMFLFFGFNGRILSNYYVGHTMFVAYFWLPLLFYCYFSLLQSRKHLLRYSLYSSLIMAMMFFEGGVHIVTWALLFLSFDVVLAFLMEFPRQMRELGVKGLRMFKVDTQPLFFLGLTVALFFLLSAIKILPGLFVYQNYQPLKVSGYISLWKFLETFFVSGLGSDIAVPLEGFAGGKELWREEGYNFIGLTGSLLAVLALGQAIIFSRDATARRMALLVLVFAVLSFGEVYYSFFGNIPILKNERVGSRFVFMSLALLAILIPIAVEAVLGKIRLKRGAINAVFLLLSLVLFAELYQESRLWFLHSDPVFVSQDAVEPLLELPARYYWYFGGGCTLSVLTLLVCCWFLGKAICKKKYAPVHW